MLKCTLRTGEADVPPIAGLRPSDGDHVHLIASGTTAVWPQWDVEVAGSQP